MADTEHYEVRGIAHPQGVGLFAMYGFERGDAIYLFDYWSRAQMPIHATNHSCDPNAGFDAGGMLRALRSIAAGEEITYDYLLYPLPASPWNFKCECQAADCKGWIDAEGVAGISNDAEPN